MTEIREFRLPDLGEGLEDAEIVKWYVDVGDQVDLNQQICDVETAKAIVAIPSPFAGRIVDRFGEVGQRVKVGEVLIRVEAEEKGWREPAGDSHMRAQDERSDDFSVLVGYGVQRDPESRPRHRFRATTAGQNPGSELQPTKPRAKPPVRKLAKDLGVDLTTISLGSGPDGTITREDVEAAAMRKTSSLEPLAPAAIAEQDADTKPGSTIAMRGTRRRIADKMVQARREIPHATCAISVDYTSLREANSVLNAEVQKHEVKITFLAFVLRATAIALRRFPILNSRLKPDLDAIQVLEPINLGIATDTPRGLMVPVIKRAEDLSLLELALELERLSNAARDGTITPSDLTDSTFTVNNFGVLGVEEGEPIINYPEAAILGIGAINKQPRLAHGAVAVREVGKMILVFDHRILDGGEAARFLNFISELLEDPRKILLYR